MNLSRAVLLLAALVFAAIGVGFLLVPVEWAAAVEISVPTPMARTDLRATYGGFDLAFGIFLALCALRAEWIRPGLLALALGAGGFGGGRLIGILVEGTASPLMLTFLVIEAAMVAVALALYRRLAPVGA